MMGRKQNIDTLSDQLALRVEPDVMIGMQTFMGITENHLTALKDEKGGLLEYILSTSNLNLAYKQVKSNKGSGGIDGMEVADLFPECAGRQADDIPAKAVNAFMKVGATGIKVIRPERAAAEEAKSEGD